MSDHVVIVPIDDEIPLLDQTPLVEEATKDERQEARKVDNHLIEIKEINGQDPSGQQKNISVNQIFDEMFEDLDISCIKSTTIFKVSWELRESNPDAYTPKMISIGPYHKKNPQLRSMKKYKLLYLQRFLKRKEGIDVESCIKELEKLKDKALNCYDDIEDNTGQFMQMLLLDGCFVVEFIRECCGMPPFGEDFIIDDAANIHFQVTRDLLLLENQLPFFVLTMLHQMTMHKDEASFSKLAKKILKFRLPKRIQEYSSETEDNEENINHLLQIVHYMSCQPLERKYSDDGPPWYNMMPNATELSEAGIRFSKVGNIHTSMTENNLEDSTSLLDIKFANGLMEIPWLEVDDYTETILRNLIAYEQESSGIKLKYFSDFAAFMDSLIDSEKDVTLLRRKGIIRNMIGEDKEVADLFNKIGKGVTISFNFYYNEECRKVIQHCEKPWNRMKANLRHNYFNSPWAGVSTVAAIILLFLTVTQTVLAFISVLK